MAGCRDDKNRRRREVWKKTNGVCAHCGKMASPQKQTIDHFIPRSWGGTYDMRNLVPLCQECNWNRRAREVNPEKFYQFAPQWVIRDCRSYQRQFERNYGAFAYGVA